jgi:hypothetical protein
MDHQHVARITWSEAQVQRGLPAVAEMIDPAWFADDRSGAEGWSLICRFAVPAAAQGSPSEALVRFLVPEAPHGRLTSGARLRLFERATGEYADVVIFE